MKKKLPNNNEKIVLPEVPKARKRTTKDELQEDIGNAMALSALCESEGGKVLIESLTNDLISAIDTIASKSGALSHIEFVDLAVKIRERMDLARSLVRAKSNEIFLRALLEKAYPDVQKEIPGDDDGIDEAVSATRGA